MTNRTFFYILAAGCAVPLLGVAFLVYAIASYKQLPPKVRFTQTDAEQAERDQMIKKWIAEDILESVDQGPEPKMNVDRRFILLPVDDKRKIATLVYLWAANPERQRTMSILSKGGKIGTFSLEEGLSPSLVLTTVK
jgi:hypothetical protein